MGKTLRQAGPLAESAKRNGLKSAGYPAHPMKKLSSSLLHAEPGNPGSPAPEGGGPVPVTYEAALEELEKLVRQLEGGQMPLDQLLTGYQRGAFLLKFCRDKLEAVEQQVKVLDAGELKPWSQE